MNKEELLSLVPEERRTGFDYTREDEGWNKCREEILRRIEAREEDNKSND